MNMQTRNTPEPTAIPKPMSPDTGISDKAAVADALAKVLADTYMLTIKTHAYHWNIVGPLFYSVHNLTEEHYTDMFQAADELAERMRALGALAPMNLSALTRDAEMDEPSGTPSARDMVQDLAASHEHLARRLHNLIDVASKADDPVTEDLATARSAFHQKAAWMLNAINEEA